MNKKLLVLFALVGALLAGCSLSQGVPATESVPTMVADALPPEVAVAIQNKISDTLGVPLDQVTIKTVEQREWPDSCLGLGKPNESCAQVITPGWLVVFDINGTQYRYRADQTGTMIRQEQ